MRARIDAACARAGVPASRVKLLAVSKLQPVEAIRAAYALGQRDFGENYVQELVHKAAALADLPELRWRLIGRLQRNKVKEVVPVGCSVDTVDSLRLGEALQARAVQDSRVIEVLVQANIGAEPQKAGVAPAELGALVNALRKLPNLRVQGLLAIPPMVAHPELNRAHFRQLRELAAAHALPELSMGMSDDLEIAIEEGATMVRVGTAVFGQRPVRTALPAG